MLTYSACCLYRDFIRVKAFKEADSSESCFYRSLTLSHPHSYCIGCYNAVACLLEG